LGPKGLFTKHLQPISSSEKQKLFICRFCLHCFSSNVILHF